MSSGTYSFSYAIIAIDVTARRPKGEETGAIRKSHRETWHGKPMAKVAALKKHTHAHPPAAIGYGEPEGKAGTQEKEEVRGARR